MNILFAKEIAESNQISDYLTSRPFGRLFADAIKKILDTSTPKVLIIDFSGIRLMDASFADEVFGNWASEKSRRVASNDSVLLVRELDEVSMENLDMALNYRTRKEKSLRNCVIPYIQPDGTLRLIGKWENHVEETFALLAKHKELTTHQLVALLNLDIAAASTRLKVLYDLGLAVRSDNREVGDRQYCYKLPI